MKRFLILVFVGLLLGGAVGGAMLGGVLDWGPKWSVLATLPGPVRAVAQHGEALLVAAGSAGLVRVGPGTDEVTVLMTPRRGMEIQDVLVADGRAYLLAYTKSARQYDLYAVDAETGDYIRSFALGSSVTDLPGFLGKRNLVVVEGAQVRIINRDTSQHYHRVVVTGGILGGAFLDRKRLYVSRRFEGGLAIIDVKEKEPALVELIETEQWLVDVEAAHGKAYVTTRKSGLGVIDLETHAFTPTDATDFFVTPSGDAYALEPGALCRLDPDGAGQRTSLPRGLRSQLDGAEASLLLVEDGHALIACADRLLALDWPVKSRDPNGIARAR